MASVDQAFLTYRQNFPPRAPDRTRIRSDDELRQITVEEGLRTFTVAPALGVATGAPPISSDTPTPDKYHWVIEPGRLSYALEALPGVSLRRGRLAHTNLTGGADAHCGGEMWFVDPCAIVFNGGSGRYPARSAQELGAIAIAFKSCGYRVANMGWDMGIDDAARYLRGNPLWM